MNQLSVRYQRIQVASGHSTAREIVYYHGTARSVSQSGNYESCEYPIRGAKIEQIYCIGTELDRTCTKSARIKHAIKRLRTRVDALTPVTESDNSVRHRRS